MSGWLRMHRQIVDSEVFADEHLLRLWIWILVRANFKRAHISMTTGRGKSVVELKPGQLIIGRNKGAESLGWKPSTFRDRLRRLELRGMVRVLSDTHWSIVSVVNWEFYQVDHRNDPTTNRQPTDTQATQSNNNKNDKKSSQTLRYDDDDLALCEYMLKKILVIAPKTKQKDLKTWANTIRQMRELDGRSLDEIRNVFSWSNANSFWQTNILSPKKLREKFATLDAKMRTGCSNGSTAKIPVKENLVVEAKKRELEIQKRRRKGVNENDQ